MDGAGMSALRVGLSSTLIEPSISQGHYDGMGVYTRALFDHLPDVNCVVRPLYFPPFRAVASAPGQDLGRRLPWSFPVRTLLDAVAGRAGTRKFEIDVFHATDYMVTRMDCPVVATLHDAIPIKYPQWTRPRLRRLKNWVQIQAAGKADQVIALSHHAVRELTECFGVPEHRITVVPCGVSHEWSIAPDPADVERTLGEHQLRPGYFLFVGTLQPRKNVERIIDSYLSLPAPVRAARQLVIVGRAGWRCEEVLDRIKAAQSAGEAVVWLNNVVGHARLRQIYAGAGVFVFPSLYEGFGIPVTEAFACGIPVVTANTTSLPEVSQGAAIEIDPESVPAIADAMRQLASDETLRSHCIAAGFERVKEFTWERTARETAAVYRKALGR